MRKMKDSGVEWIGEIPDKWQTRNLFYLLSLIGSGTTPKGDEYYTGIGIPWLNTGDLNDGYIYSTNKYVSENALNDYSALQVYKPGSIVIAMYGATIGKLGLTEIELTTNQACCVMNTTKEMDRKILFYILMTAKDYFIFLSYGAGQPNISQKTIKHLKIPFANICEQKKIANYLDTKCSKIDGIVAKQRAIIEKLKEYKLSIITEVVTKGLNPDAEMMDSGNIEIGKIPSISRPTKLKYLCNTQGRIGFKGYTTTDLVDEGEGAYTLGASHLNNGKIDLTDPVFISWEKYYESPEIMVKQNDILIVQRGSTIGKVAIVDKNYGEVTINPSLVLINKIHIDSKYLLYALSARYIANYINLIGTTTAIPMISQKQINDLVVIVPPDSIQISVVKYLDEKCGKIDANILKKQKLIDKLLEYKKSLIYEVVTGKKEV